MRRIALVLAGLFLIIALFVLAAVYGREPKTERRQVRFIMNLDYDSERKTWYWAQVCLPRHGVLKAEITKAEYDRWKHFPRLYRSGHVGRKWFWATYTDGGESVPGKYGITPTEDEDFPKYAALIFFCKDGSIWRIPIPDKIRRPQAGTTMTTATIYR